MMPRFYLADLEPNPSGQGMYVRYLTHGKFFSERAALADIALALAHLYRACPSPKRVVENLF